MRKFLIVVDMQKDFTYGALKNDAAVHMIPAIVEKIKREECRVIFTRDTHQENYLDTQEGRNLPIKHCIRDTEGWQLVDELEEIRREKNCQVFDKGTFGSVELAQMLKEEQDKQPIDEIEFVGTCTDICVISNVMLVKAYLPEVKLAVCADCCAGVSEESHRNALSAMASCQVEIREE